MRVLRVLKEIFLPEKRPLPKYTHTQCVWLRVGTVLVMFLSASVGPTILTFECLSKYHSWISSYNKFQSLPWEIHVVNIKPDMIRGGNKTFRCKSKEEL